MGSLGVGHLSVILSVRCFNYGGKGEEYEQRHTDIKALVDF